MFNYKMVKQKQMTIQQREKGLIELIKDAEELGFNGSLIKGYKTQLTQVQAEIKWDKEKSKSFNSERTKEKNLKKVGDTKPLLASEKAVSMALKN